MMKLCGDNKVQREPKMKLKDWKIRCPQGEYGAELRTGEKMQRRRLRSGRLNVARFSLTCALVVITLTATATVHFLSSPSVVTLPNIHGLRKQGETGTKEWRGEMRWMQEFSPRHMSKLEGVIGSPQLEKLWKQPHNGGYVQCVEPSSMYSNPDNSRGYLLVHTNGGLNQMRAGICDMVAVARIINATLVIPELDKGSFWQDLSNFSDVFKEAHFITSLANDVRIIKKLPKELRKAKKKAKDFRSWSGLSYYQNEMSRLWNVYEVIRAAKSDSRLANNGLPSDIQKLRCRCLYGALQFAPRIEALGKLLVERMKSYGPYVALHLRYEKDILAFSGCSYGLSSDDADELARIRMATTHWKVKDIDPIEQRGKGDCPLTPKEVGLFLSSLGYPPSTPIYIAAGTIYGGETHMGDLQARFPLLMNKEKLASSEELMPFKKYASQLAALDYIVSVESDVFLPSYSGNMARAVEGHRRFLGHRTTISPDRKTLVRLFDKLWRGEIEDETKLSKAVVNAHKRRRGSPRKRSGPKSGSRGKDRFRSEETFYENPLPDCLCKKGTADRGKLL